MCCGGSAHWKREEVPDHKFDFIDVRDFRDRGCFQQAKYTFLFLMVIKSFAVYVADIYTAITLLAFGHFSGSLYEKVQDDPENNFRVPISYGRWIFTGCIIFSFLLLAYEVHKSRAIVKSRDISYAYTNVMANNYYSLRSYDHYCFFNQINDSNKKKDEVAFFIFFTFKGWKRLLVADGPRQIINFFTLYGLGSLANWSSDPYDYYEGNIMTAIMIITQLFTVVVFAGSMILLMIAALMYIPLLCYIKGNLKEYCCHKVDKRVTDLVHRKKKQRLAKVADVFRREAAGDFSHLKDKKGNLVGRAMPQPTLPKMDVDLLLRDEKLKGMGESLHRAGSIGSSTAVHTANYVGAQQGYTSPGLGASQFYGNHAPSVNSLGYEKPEYGSQAHLPANAGYAGGDGGMETLMNDMGPNGTSPMMYAQRVTPGHPVYGQQYGSERSLLDPRTGMQHRPSFNTQRGASPGPYDNDAASFRNSPYQQPQRIHGQERSQPDYPPPQDSYGADGLDYPPPEVPSNHYAGYSEQHDQYSQPGMDDITVHHDGGERYLKVDESYASDHRQQPSPDPSAGGGGGYEDLYDAYLHSQSHSPAMNSDRRHSYMMTDYNSAQGGHQQQQQDQWSDQTGQQQQQQHYVHDQQQTSNGYDEQHAHYRYDELAGAHYAEQAGHHYDDQASHSYDQDYYHHQVQESSQHADQHQWTQEELDQYYQDQQAYSVQGQQQEAYHYTQQHPS